MKLTTDESKTKENQNPMVELMKTLSGPIPKKCNISHSKNTKSRKRKILAKRIKFLRVLGNYPCSPKHISSEV